MTAWFIWTRGFREPWAAIVHRDLLQHEKPGAKNSSTLVAYRVDEPTPPIEELVKLYPPPKPDRD